MVDMEKIVSPCKGRWFIFQSERDLRRHGLVLGLRTARRGAEKQRQAPPGGATRCRTSPPEAKQLFARC
jgi:hypothetical protein